jgi:hypothetical protein
MFLLFCNTKVLNFLNIVLELVGMHFIAIKILLNLKYLNTEDKGEILWTPTVL